MKKLDNLSLLIFFSLIILNLLVWFEIVFAGPATEPEVYFLDVGQGDSALIIFPGGVKMLTDAGYGSKIIRSLANIKTSKYIDIAIISHPQTDHFSGFNYILDRYQIGAFIINGRKSETPEWQELMEKIKDKEIPLITLAAGDKIKYQQNLIDFLSPAPIILQSAELNDTSFVNLIQINKISEKSSGTISRDREISSRASFKLKILLTGDIGFNVEKFLTENYESIKADVLKVGHHGSKYSTSKEFLEAVDPLVAVIEVGENRYGHPTEEVLARLKRVRTFRTDEDGTVKITASRSKLQVFTETGRWKSSF